MTRFDTVNPAYRYKQAIAWWVLSELARRHPQWTILERHPHDGMYDFRALGESRGRDWQSLWSLNLNPVGSAHFDDGTESWPEFWIETLAQDDPHAMIRQVERRLGVSPPAPVPATTPKTLIYRVLARIAAASVDLKKPIDIRSGYEESSDMDGSYPRPLEEWFPHAKHRIVQTDPDDFLSNRYYRFWYITAGDTPIALVETSGHGWNNGAAIGNLYQHYRGGSTVQQIATSLMGSHW